MDSTHREHTQIESLLADTALKPVENPYRCRSIRYAFLLSSEHSSALFVYSVMAPRKGNFSVSFTTLTSTARIQ